MELEKERRFEAKLECLREKWRKIQDDEVN